MAPDSHLEELLLQWEELAEQGRPATAEELCRHCPELADRLKGRIAMLRAMDGVFEQETLTVGQDGCGADSPSREQSPRVPGYEILGELGRGGMGVVYKARQVKLNRHIALKMILAGGHAGRQERLRFQSEAEAVGRLQHPNIVQIYDVGEQDGCPYLALEYVDGGSLADRLDGTPLSPPEAAALVQTLAAAIHAAHQRGIVHRDLKPGNILLGERRA